MDWQPIPKLAQQLSQATQSMNTEVSPWDRVVINATGVWQAYVNHQSSAWPLSLRPPRPNPPAPPLRPVGLVRQSLWRRILWFWRRPRRVSAPVAPAPRILQPPDLATALTNCYTWLNAQILQQATQWFSPYWTELPVELAIVSERAVIWTLYAWALHEKQTAVILQDPFLPATQYAIDGAAQPGDALALHIILEHLMQTLPSAWLIQEKSSIVPRPGGLRTASFLRAYAALSSPQAPPPAQAWRKALDRLIAGSPLTQLIYIDLLSGSQLPDSCASLVPIAIQTSTDKDKSRQQEWRDLWYSQLARSLLGALLKEAPIDLTAYSSDERRARAAQSLQRLARICSLFQDGQGKRRCTYLQMRLLDMLVRHVVTQAMPAMLAEWQRLDPESNPWARTELFNEGGGCFNMFTATLFGHTSVDAFLALLTQEQKQSLRRNLEILLDLPTPSDLAQWASEVGVRENAAARGWTRFTGEPMGGIPLPLPAPNHLAPAPQTLLADWLPLLLNRLPQATVTVVASGAENAAMNDERDEPYSSYDY